MGLSVEVAPISGGGCGHGSTWASAFRSGQRRRPSAGSAEALVAFPIPVLGRFAGSLVGAVDRGGGHGKGEDGVDCGVTVFLQTLAVDVGQGVAELVVAG